MCHLLPLVKRINIAWDAPMRDIYAFYYAYTAASFRGTQSTPKNHTFIHTSSLFVSPLNDSRTTNMITGRGGAGGTPPVLGKRACIESAGVDEFQ